MPERHGGSNLYGLVIDVVMQLGPQSCGPAYRGSRLRDFPIGVTAAYGDDPEFTRYSKH